MVNDFGKKLVAFFLIVIVLVGNIWSGAYKYIDEIIEFAFAQVENENSSVDMPEYEEIAADYLLKLPFKNNMVELNGMLAKNLNMRSIHKDDGGILLDNGYVVGVYDYTSTDYELQQCIELKSFLDERGIPMLYVNEPTKYIDDGLIEAKTGIATYINDNADHFLNKLDENGIANIDFKDYIMQEGANSFDFFYKTDHHWTTMTGKLAAEEIAKELNENFGYDIDLALYDADKFQYQEYNNAWLGEQGRKLGETFTGLDDFTFIIPDYETRFNVTYEGNSKVGSFAEVFTRQELYRPENNVDCYADESWHYSYGTAISGAKVQNLENTHKKKVLVLGDSYENITVPFLALGVSELHWLILRNYDGNLKEYIVDNNIDTVIIAYASFMIGAHDDETSANYSMFDFQ